jgi:selenocysteine lyase/cysteine desulfurase
MALWQRFRNGLNRLRHIRTYGTPNPERSVGIVSLNVEKRTPTDLGFILDARFGILTRTGLHCAPLAHETIGTAPEGTVRFSLGFASTEEDIDQTLEALAKISEQ